MDRPLVYRRGRATARRSRRVAAGVPDVPARLGGEPARPRRSRAAERVPTRYRCCSLGSPSLASTSRSVAEPAADPPHVERGRGQQAAVGEQAAGVVAVVGQLAADEHPAVGQVGRAYPGTGSTQRGSASSACTWVSPVRGSTASTRPCCCSRRSTVTSGPPTSDHETDDQVRVGLPVPVHVDPAAVEVEQVQRRPRRWRCRRPGRHGRRLSGAPGRAGASADPVLSTRAASTDSPSGRPPVAPVAGRTPRPR